jgi:arylsulfatase A-like enzyme
MGARLSRRDFLKLLSLLPLASAPFYLGRSLSEYAQAGKSRNFLVLLFDAWSARHVSLYGYPRKTMPNLERLAERAIVYHRHYSPGNFTTPGTGSLLTGTYPWTHRGMHPYGTLSREYNQKTGFTLFKEYTRVAFSHNVLVNIMMDEFKNDLDKIVLPNELSVFDGNLSDNMFPEDYGLALLSELTYLSPEGELPNSLYGSLVRKYFHNDEMWHVNRQWQDQYPRGVADNRGLVMYFLEHAIDWMVAELQATRQPSFAYIHMLPPHAPYKPREEFVGMFDNDGFEPPLKPEHRFSEGRAQEYLNKERRLYDEYIAFVDSEIGRLFEKMEKESLLDDTVVVLTTDHGEMFERGIYRHSTRVLYEPLIHIPLLIFTPDQNSRQDVHIPTSSIDVLPTLLHLAGQDKAEWLEGELLPPYQKSPSNERSLYALEAQLNSKFTPLDIATFSLIKGNYKLIYYRGYSGIDGTFELYDIENDPEEMNDLADSSLNVFSDLKEELLKKIDEINQVDIQDVEE